MYRFLGTCGLALTFSAAGQTAGGGGGTAAAGGTSGGSAAGAGTATAGTATTARPAAPASGPRIATGVGGAGQSVSGTAGQSTTATPGQSTTTQPAAPASTTTSGATLPGQNPTGTLPGATSGTITGPGVVQTPVALTTLPATTQAQIVGQIPPGSTLAGVIQETTPQGVVTYRAQISQGGQIREIALTPGTTAQNFTRAGTLQTAAEQTSGAAVSGLVPAPVAFGTLPTTVQGALTTQSAGAPLSNLTFTPGINGAGMYRAMVNGRPVEVRVGPNGQILPATAQLATTSSNTDTNDLKMDDLPEAVQNSIRNSSTTAEVASIRRVEGLSGDLYDVTLRGDGKESKFRVDKDGTLVEEKREEVVAIANTAPVNTNEPPRLAFNSLPQTVRSAIAVRTDQKSLRALFLTNYNGKTAYAADYLDKEALRHRLYIGKDGLVVNTVTNMLGIRPSGQLMVENLPAAARATVEREASGQVMRVDNATRGTNAVYVVTYMKDGELQQMIVNPEGLRVDGLAVGAPPSAEVGTPSAETGTK